jgi:hypothetical protein
MFYDPVDFNRTETNDDDSNNEGPPLIKGWQGAAGEPRCRVAARARDALQPSDLPGRSSASVATWVEHVRIQRAYNSGAQQLAHRVDRQRGEVHQEDYHGPHRLRY